MWHEARRQEKKIRGLMVDYKKRAERRRNYYEMIKKDPCSFLRLTGGNMKIHLDPAIAAAAEGPQSMMAWCGDRTNMIDRFDVRSHLDFIPDYKSQSSLPDALEIEDDMKCNYDRYRIVVQNECAGISEESALKQIEVDEKYGDVSKNKEQEEKKKALAGKKAAIGFSYDDAPPAPGGFNPQIKKSAESSEEEDEEDFDDVDLDIAFDIDQISSELKQQLDTVAITYGMSVGEFAEQLRKDKEDEQALREAKLAEQEKAAMSGRKSRRERRIYKETMLRLRGTSPPRYYGSGVRGSPTYKPVQASESDSSRSNSPVNDTLEFITNLGEDNSTSVAPTVSKASDERELPPHLRMNLSKTQTTNSWKKERLRDQESPEFMVSANPDKQSGSSATSADKRDSKLSPPAIKRYRRESLEKKSSDSDVTSGSDDDSSKRKQQRSSYRSRIEKSGHSSGSTNQASKASSSSASTSTGKKTSAHQERLKRKMQAALNRTYKEDKRTAAEKQDQARREQKEREADIRQKVEDIRRKDHVRRGHSSDSSSDSDRGSSRRRRSYSRSRSRSRSSSRSKSASRGRSRSRSRSRDKPAAYDSPRYSRGSRSRYDYNSSRRRSPSPYSRRRSRSRTPPARYRSYR